jgi:fructokinase
MEKKFKIGIDYGGTKIEGILMDQEGKEVLRKRSTYDKNYQSGLDTVKSLVEEFDQYSGSKNSVGICIPGFSSRETGLVNNANCVWINDQPFQKDLEKTLNRDVRMMNDANCFALSEAIDGSGANYRSIWGIIIGSGFGGSFVYNKEVVEGVNQVAGDWGHQPLPYPTQEEYELNVECQVGIVNDLFVLNNLFQELVLLKYLIKNMEQIYVHEKLLLLRPMEMKEPKKNLNYMKIVLQD